MFCLPVIFLGFIMSTCVEAGIVQPHHYLMFDVVGDITADDVKSAMETHDATYYLFQAVGGQRYFIVFESGHTPDLKTLRFPGATRVTPYLTERSDEFYARYGADKSNMDVGKWQDDELVVAEIDFLFQGLDLAEYSAMLKKIGNELQKLHADTGTHGLHVLGQLPAKVFTFSNIFDGIVQRILGWFGQPSYVTIKTTPVIRIK